MKNTTRCFECGGKMATRNEPRRYGRGVDVILHNVEVRHCGKCGEENIVIPHIESLHKLIAISLAKRRGSLSPGEIRFMRTYLGYSSQDFAAFLGVVPETVTRWERLGGSGMTPAAERLLRFAVLVGKPIDSYGFENISIDSSVESPPPKFCVRDDGWVPAELCC